KSHSTSILPSFFYLPSARKIVATSVLDLGITGVVGGPDENPPAYLIALCPNLKSFKYQHSDDCHLSLGYQPESLGPLVGFVALRELRKRLANLLDIQDQAEPTVPLIDILLYSIEKVFIEGCKEEDLATLVGVKGTFRNDSFHRHSEVDDSLSGRSLGGLPDELIKDEALQITERLRTHCAIAGIDFHLYDRTSDFAGM
ncbi:hypothetical protein N7492_008569, partial [Penicillium capsulatum]